VGSTREELNALIIEANRVVEDSHRYLDVAEELVVGIPRRRTVVEERIAFAAKLRDEAYEEWKRVENDEGSGRAEEREAGAAYDEARSDYSVFRRELGSDDLDPENRKAVARHLTAMAREDFEQRLDAIASRGEGPELRKAIAEYKDEVFRSAHYLMTRRFAEARSLLNVEVRTTRAEAHNIFDLLKNSPAGR